MEVVLYFAFTAVWWLSTLTILLPFVLLLKYSKTFSNRWFSWFFANCCGPLLEPKLTPQRITAFALLEDHLFERDASIPLEILEIGIGWGANFEYYPENARLTANDMNATFESHFRTNKTKYPRVSFERTVNCMAEKMKEVKDSSMDVVISTYVLCSVSDVDAVLSEVHRVLKPGGKFLFLEHVSYPPSEWSAVVQRVAAPLWHLYVRGCRVHRRLDVNIGRAGFSSVHCVKKYPSSLVMFVRPQAIGIATK